jgi:hypothetical protein
VLTSSISDKVTEEMILGAISLRVMLTTTNLIIQVDFIKTIARSLGRTVRKAVLLESGSIRL